MGGLASGVEPLDPGDVPRALVESAVLDCKGAARSWPWIRDCPAFSRAEWDLGALAARLSPAEDLLPAVLGALPLPGITGGLNGIVSDGTVLPAVAVGL